MPNCRPCRAPRTRGGRFAVIDPATGEAFDDSPDQQPDELDGVVGRAHEAWQSWRTDPVARATALLAAADAVEAAGRGLAPLLTREQGKPLAESYAEIAGTAARLRYFAEPAPEPRPITDGRPVRGEIRWRPLGPVAAIVPWSFPLQLASAKIAPALAAGNTVVLKPSPFTPLATRLLASVVSAALPEDVLTVVTGREPLGARLASHPGIRHVTFTGSVPTGRAVAEGAAASLARVTLELGGNDAAILLDDVDVERVAERLFWAAFRNCGQVCTAVKRVYAPARLCSSVAEALAQYAKSDGGRAVSGGHRLDRLGYFFAPTILADVPSDSPAVTEEQFGPVLPVLPYGSLDEAVEAANDTCYGLGGSVWGTDLDRAEAVADRLECGTVWINHHAEPSLAQPFAGVKESGAGVAGGPWGLYGNLRPFVVHRPQEA
ncbi:aldehyde dehydrogenase family protein [Streptomyces sp. NPDC048669]|uniref:aldehyde dehydrogenase family protein n=1 Tax=Streptomyces sp. NPDC048669 TaxID=3155267 RepID=UPI0034195EB6